MPKDDMETQCMNEMFNSGETAKMKAQIYVKSADDYTAVVVSSNKGNIYFRDVLEVPEITGIQRGASFVKNELDADSTEIFPDKLKPEDYMRDAYLNYCRINHQIGKEPNPTAEKRCTSELQTFLRWNTLVKKGNER